MSLCAGEKELIDCGQLALDIFSALKDEFKVNIFYSFGEIVCVLCVYVV